MACDVAPEMPPEVGVATAVTCIAPLTDGFQVHVAVKVDADPVAARLMQLAILLPSVKKVILAETVTTAVRTTGTLCWVEETLPAIAKVEKEVVSTTFVTVTVTVSYPALLELSSALKTIK